MKKDNFGTLFNYTILAILIIMTIFIGCIAYKDVTQSKKSKEYNDFTNITTCGTGNIVYDNDTNVEYYISKEGNMTMLVNKDGSPKIYSK